MKTYVTTNSLLGAGAGYAAGIRACALRAHQVAGGAIQACAQVGTTAEHTTAAVGLKAT